MKMTVLSDNTPWENLRGEWGLSIFIEYEGKTVLLDTGGSALFSENAEKLGLDLKKVDLGVLSHAHYDHSLGLGPFFKANDTALFYLAEKAKPDCYKKVWILKKYIGIPKRIEKTYAERFRYVTENTSPAPGVHLIPHHTENLMKLGEREKMFRKTEKGFVYDDFSHELSLVFETEKGLLIFNSCSHGGVDNIIREVREALPGKPVYGYVGGLHLFNKTEEEVRKVAEKIRESGISYVCTGHCTKDIAYGILKEELGDVIHPLHVGLTAEF